MLMEFSAPGFVSDHRAQSFHVLHVFLQILSFRCFQHFRDFAKATIAHDETKRIQSDLAFPDVFVPIDARAARGFGIVQMKRDETIQSDDAIELAKRFLASFAADVVTGGKNMRGIETNTEPFRLADIGNDVGEMFEAMAEARTLAGGRFERDARFHFRNPAKTRSIDCDDSRQAGFFARAEMRAWMQNQKRQFELIGANQFFAKARESSWRETADWSPRD